MALGALCAALPNRSLGAQTDEFVRLIWIRGVHAETCPGQLEVERQVRWRLGRDPFQLDAPRMIEAKVSLVDDLWHAELSVRDNTGALLGQRLLDVKADNCGQVVDAVGLAVALAIDPNVSFESRVPPLPSAAAPSRNRAPIAPAQAPVKPAASPSQPMPEYVGPAQNVRLDKSRYEYELTLRGLVAAGLLPGLAPGVGVAGAFGAKGLRLTLGLSFLPETKLDDGYSFGLSAASAGFCADAFRSGPLSASLCGELIAGAMHAVVYRLEPLHPGDYAFAALGVGPKLGLHAFSPFFIEGGFSAALDFLRPTFAIRSASTVFVSSLVSGIGYIGLGVAVP